ncbi:MAG: response regulator [Desulfobacterales bacterium]|nr:response regulator [Desulfobacterales bacterium]
MKIQIVEDEILVAEDIAMSLKDMGYNISSIVSSGKEAIHRSEQDKPDLIIMDIVLKGEIDGIDTASKITQIYDIPIIFLTAFSDNSIIERAKSIRPYGYLIKPFSEKELNITIQMALEKSSMEKKIKESELKYKTLFEDALDMINIFDEKGIIIDSNRMELETLGYLKDEYIGKNFFEIIHPDFQNIFQKEFKKVITGSIIKCLRIAFLSKSRKKIDVEINVVPYFMDYKFQNARAISRNITEQILLEMQLRQSQKIEAIGMLAGGIAHDFNNIIAIIMGNTQLVIDEIPKDHKSHDNINHIYKACLRAKDLAKKILTFSRKTQIVKQSFNLVPLVKESLKMLRAIILPHIEIKQNIKCKNDRLFGDPTEINQLLMNLCLNAAKSMNEKGGLLTINIENSEDQSLIKMTVEDTGKGIDPKVQDKIFNPYFTTKELGEGTGLGLSIVHSIVQNYQGKIFFESKINKGTIFNIFFPIHTTSTKDENIDQSEIIRGSETILFIDDEEEIVKMMENILKNLGYSVITYTSPIQVLDILKNNPPNYDLIITDMTMPKMKGIEFSKEILKINKDIPIILLTGLTDDSFREEAEKVGIKSILIKPIEKNILSIAIRNALNKI